MANRGGERDPPPRLLSSDVTAAKKTNEDTRSIKASSRYGEPAIIFQPCDVEQGSIGFKNALIGKFNFTEVSQSPPDVDAIRCYIKEKWQMVGECWVSVMDFRHVLFNFSHREGMVKIWLKELDHHNVLGFPIKVFKWSPMFRPGLDHDPSVVPVWITFPNLPLFCYAERNLRSVASLIGEVLAVDAHTQNCTRLDSARICVILDLEHAHPSRVWIAIGNADEGFWQSVVYDRLPSFCSQCRKLGHSVEKFKSSRLITDFVGDGESQKKGVPNAKVTIENEEPCNAAVLAAETEPPAGTGLQLKGPQLKNERVTEDNHECQSNPQPGQPDQVMGSYGMVNGGRNLLYIPGGNAVTPSHTRNQIHGFNNFGGSAMAATPASSSFYNDKTQFSGICNQQNSLIPRERVREAPGTGRKCQRCPTMQTPMWRNGPEGRQTLCNACGIRYKREQRKALGIRDSGTSCKGDPRENKFSKSLVSSKTEEKVFY